MSTLKELQEALRDARSAYEDVRAAHMERVSVLLAEARTKANNEFKERLDIVSRAKYEAEQAEFAERNRLAILGEGAPFPVGTRMVEWEYRHPGYFAGKDAKREFVKTGTVGVVEVITLNSAHPGNTSDYSHAKVGDAVIRICKKDGTPGIKYIIFGRGSTGMFLPEGRWPVRMDERGYSIGESRDD